MHQTLETCAVLLEHWITLQIARYDNDIRTIHILYRKQQYSSK
jgi:hypothetical protein